MEIQISPDVLQLTVQKMVLQFFKPFFLKITAPNISQSKSANMQVNLIWLTFWNDLRNLKHRFKNNFIALTASLCAKFELKMSFLESAKVWGILNFWIFNQHFSPRRQLSKRYFLQNVPVFILVHQNLRWNGKNNANSDFLDRGGCHP